MKWNLATDEQLLTICKHDKDCPLSLMREVVTEMLNRNMFDALIRDRVHYYYKDMKKTEQWQKMGLDDFMQFGRMEVFKALNRFEPGRGHAFFSFAFLRVSSELCKLMSSQQMQKRDAKKVLSMHQETDKGDDFSNYFFDEKMNVEKYVINKVLVEQLLERVNERQRKVVLLRMAGYENQEIAEIIGEGSASSISQSFKYAKRKMKEGA